MKRRIFASVIGVACLPACGDNGKPGAVIDASGTPTDSLPGPGSDAAADAPGDAFVRIAPVLEYNFEESDTVVKDTSGRGKDGTLSDPAAWTADGRDGRGIALLSPTGGPSTQFISIPSGVLDGVKDFTIATWVRANSVGNWARIYDFGNARSDADARYMFLSLRGFVLAPDSPPPPADPKFKSIGLHASSFGGDRSKEIIDAPGTEVPLGVWKHLTVTGSGGTRRLFVDGYPVATASASAEVAAAPETMEPLAGTSWIGKSRFESSGDAALDATLDNFKVYARVLSQDEISALASPNHDYSYWRFDDGTGTTAKDASANNIETALIEGATWTTGQLGGAIDLPGGPKGAVGPHVALTTSPLAGCSNSATVAVWVKLRTAIPFSRVFDFGDGGTFFYLAATDGHGMHFAMGKPGIPAFDLSATNPIPPDNAWHHAAVTVQPTGLVTLYLDGKAVGADTSLTLKPGDYVATTQNWLGKSQFFVADAYLDAALDELRISCRAYTGDEIKNLATPLQP